MGSDEEKILSIKVNYSDAINGIVKYQEAIKELKAREDELKKQLEDGNISQEEYAKEMEATKQVIKEYNDNIRVLSKEVQNNLKQESESVGSLKSLRAELSNVTKEYDSLSEAERNGAKGNELKSHINEITNELKSSEEATQRYYRNVGNYENSIKAALGSESKWFQSLQSLNSVLSGGVSGACKMAGEAVQGFGKQLLALLANPIVAIIAAIAAAVMLLVAAFKKGVENSASNSARLKEALAPVKALLDAIIKVCVFLVAQILSVVEAGEKMIGWLMKMAEKLPIVGDKMKEVNKTIQEHIDLQREEIMYARMTRDEIVASAQRENEIAKLRDKVAQKDKYNNNERKNYLKQAIEIEKQQSQEKIRLARINLDILQKEFNAGKQDADQLQKLAEAKAAVINADTEFYTSTRRQQTQLASFNQDIINDEKSKQKEANEKAKEAQRQRLENLKDSKQKEKQYVREAEDAMLEILGDSEAAQRQKLILSYDRKIEDLRDKLKTEKNLNVNTRKAMHQEIVALEEDKNRKLEKLKDEQISKEIEKEEKNISLLLQSVKKGSDAEYQLKMSQLEKEKEAEENAVKNSIESEEEKYNQLWAIRNKYNLLFDQLTEEHDNDILKKQEEAIKKRYEMEILSAGSNEVDVLTLKMQQKEEELNTMQQYEGESIDAFNLRKLQKQKEYNDAKKALDDKEVAIEKAKTQAISDVVGGLAAVTDALGEHNKAFAKLSKVLALAQIAINTGEAIAAGVKQAQAVPYPGNIVAIATTVAAVLGNIAAAIKTVNSAKFATGGLVSGSGSSTSDSISAQLSDGESVMTAGATSMFAPALSVFNQIGGGVPIVVSNSSQAIGEEYLANAVAKGVMRAPAPVVSVEEFTQVSNRVKYIERLGNI